MVDGAAEGLGQVGAAERWQVGSRERVYDGGWMAVELVEVVPPRRAPYRHHVVRVADAVGVVVVRADGRVLLLHRHRFATDTVGFEVPAGAIHAGESVEDAARREVLEETGLHLRSVRPFYQCGSSDGVSAQRFHLALGEAGADTGTIVDDHESAVRVWVDRDEITALLREGRVPGALSSVALLYALWNEHL